jgi:glycine dehydrogenase subunit 1
VAELCYHKAHYAAKLLGSIPGYRLWSDDPFFHEFVLECPEPVADLNAYLLERDILGGYDLSQDYPELPNHTLIAVTEMNSRADIELLADALAERATEVSPACTFIV